MRAGPNLGNHKALRWEWRRRRKWRTIHREEQGAGKLPMGERGAERSRCSPTLSREPRGREAGRKIEPVELGCNYRGVEKPQRRWRKRPGFADERRAWHRQWMGEESYKCIKDESKRLISLRG